MGSLARRGVASAFALAAGLPGVDARADVAVEWQGSAAATVGVTTNVANTPVPALDAPVGTPAPEWDGFASITPGIQLSFETPRTRQILGYAFDYRLYFLHMEANAVSNSLGYTFNADVSQTTALTLGVALSQTQASAFNLVGTSASSPTLTTSTDAYLLTGVLSQSLTTHTTANDTFAEGLSFTVNDNIPIAAEGQTAPEPSLTYLTSGTLSGRHEFKRDTLGGTVGTDLNVFPTIVNGANTTPGHDDIIHRATLDWRHDWSPDWSHTITVGALATYEATVLEPLVNPAGSASLDFVNERGSAGLSYTHGVQPNIVLQQLTLADTVTLRGALPLGNTGLDLSGAAAFLSSRFLQGGDLSPVTYNASVDAALGYSRDGLPLRFALRYQLNRQFGLGSDAEAIPEIRRQTLQLTITAYFPRAPNAGAAPSLVPLPSPSSNPSALGNTSPSRGQIEDGEREESGERRENREGGEGKEGGAK